MFESLALVLLLANAAQEQPPAQQGIPTDPLFNKPLVATDGPAFVLSAIAAARQDAVDARNAADALNSVPIRDAASKIAQHSESTRAKLAAMASEKGWRLPDPPPDRDTTLAESGQSRAGANFIISQISFHENMVAQFRAQIAGKGDSDLDRVLRETLPGYQKNLDLLLKLKL